MTSIVIDKETADRPLASRQETETVLSVEHVSKKFCRSLKRSLYYGVRDIATQLTGGRRRSGSLRVGEFWALQDVSLQLRRGEALGLVGPNGAGKSTLLRLISGLIKPDTGAIRVRGRVAPLIALGAGFNPVLTGRENVYANMSILGLSRKEVDEKFQEVLDFAEIGDALDAPVQTYSSGMAARLGFACAIHTDPDILLIDEVLAVGDLKFRMKCYRRLARLRADGTAFILVSHNPQSILAVCNSAVYISEGRLLESGDADAVMRKYEEDLFLTSSDDAKFPGVMSLPEKPAGESTGLDMLALYFRDSRGHVIDAPVCGEPANLCIECRSHEPIGGVGVNLIIREVLGENESVLTLDAARDGGPLNVPSGKFEIRLQMPYCGLKPGLYTAKINLNKDSIHLFDGVEAYRFKVGTGGTNTSQSLFYQPRSWEVVGAADREAR